MRTKRSNFLKKFEQHPEMITVIPQVTNELLLKQFGFKFVDPKDAIIVFSVGWTEIVKFVASQQYEEYALDVCGVSLEYVTEYTESDKSSNIVPQMIHKRLPIFVEKEFQVAAASESMKLLNTRSNEWRTANLVESQDKIEDIVFNRLLNEYGLQLSSQSMVLNVLAAMYVAGVEYCKNQGGAEVNMYNWFTINIVDNNILLQPSAACKQMCKNDQAGQQNRGVV
jgi:hypothetical protein